MPRILRMRCGRCGAVLDHKAPQQSGWHVEYLPDGRIDMLDTPRHQCPDNRLGFGRSMSDEEGERLAVEFGRGRAGDPDEEEETNGYDAMESTSLRQLWASGKYRLYLEQSRPLEAGASRVYWEGTP